MPGRCSGCWRGVPVLPERFAAYLAAAGEQIRWRRARPVLLRELRTHLMDQRDDCAAAGLDEEAAQAEALRQMGDPVAVGTELDRVHRPRPQWGLLAFVWLLALACGFLRVWLTRGVVYGGVRSEPTALALLQGTAVFLGAYFLDYTFLGRHGKALYAAALAAGVLSLWQSPHVNNASYFTRYVVLAYPVVYAAWIYAWRGRGLRGLLAAVGGGVPLVCIGLLVPYTFGTGLLLVTGLCLLVLAARQDWFGAGRRLSLLLPAGVAAALAGTAGWLLLRGAGAGRLQALLHPELDPLGAGYAALTVRSALAGANWLGEGVLEGTFAGYGYWDVIPAGGSDFLLTTLIHALGWMPFLLLLAAFGALVAWLLVKALRQQNQLGRMVAVAVVLTLGLQGLCSVVLNLGLVLTSAAFPLLVGNLHTVLDMALLGLALSVFRQERIPEERPEPHPPVLRRPRVSWRDGELVIALGRWE